MDASDRYHGLHAAYKKAEDALHSLGIEAGGVDTAAVNELRYAGRHLLNGLVSDDPDDQDEQFLRSRRHCERALYEAYDSAIYYHFAQYDQFKADYRRIVISDVIPNFVSIEKTMKEARDFLIMHDEIRITERTTTGKLPKNTRVFRKRQRPWRPHEKNSTKRSTSTTKMWLNSNVPVWKPHKHRPLRRQAESKRSKSQLSLP